MKSRITEMIDLEQTMSHPSGKAYLGSTASVIEGWILEKTGNPVQITFDSGSEITLISTSTYNRLRPKPEAKKGKKIRLCQVTGESFISKFIKVPLLFNSDNGTVRLMVEAYIVDSMTVPFILGNDFASLYQLSLLRSGQDSHIQMGNSGRLVPVISSTTKPRTDDAGNVFTVQVFASRITHRPAHPVILAPSSDKMTGGDSIRIIGQAQPKNSEPPDIGGRN